MTNNNLFRIQIFALLAFSFSEPRMVVSFQSTVSHSSRLSRRQPTTTSERGKYNTFHLMPSRTENLSNNHDDDATETALFGMGCFWKPQQTFSDVPGVVQAVAGYASVSGVENDGGKPSYVSVCSGDGNTEAVLVKYRPSDISYSELLQIFWQNHDASIASKAQYRSVIWPQSPQQYEIALQDIEKASLAYQEERNLTVKTLIVAENDRNNFVPAESIHQQFWTKFQIKALALAGATLTATSMNSMQTLLAKTAFFVLFMWAVWEAFEVLFSAISSLFYIKKKEVNSL